MAKEVSDALRESADKPAFTPGPWEVAEPSMGFSEVRGANGELVFGLAAGLVTERQGEEVCEANARLISAAPRMYAVLKAIMSDTGVSVESGNEIRDIFKSVEGR